MAHATFIHGIANKPPRDFLHEAWLRTLKEGDGLDLGMEGVTSSMVYWADVLYEAPLSEEGYESVEDFEGAAELKPELAPEEAASARTARGGWERAFSSKARTCTPSWATPFWS